MSGKKGGYRPRIRAHRNPLSAADYKQPLRPSEYDWAPHYPAYFGVDKQLLDGQDGKEAPRVTVADIGCGFGALLENLGPIMPNKLILGVEIRPQVVDLVKKRVLKLRAAAAADADANAHHFNNISVEMSNIMKYCPNYFEKAQLETIFFCFPDPHFKKANYRRRVISVPLLDTYAFCLRPGGLAYTITDVENLHDWMRTCFEEHPLFEKVEGIDEETDPVINAMKTTDEGLKVTRNGGSKWVTIFRRIESK